MIFNWFKIFNENEFNALDLFSKAYVLELEGIGEKRILAVKGVALGLVYEDVFLSLDLNAISPFYFNGHAIYKNEATGDIYLGIEQNES